MFFFLILLLVAPAYSQPVEKGKFRPAELVELVNMDSSIRLDIRYATEENFMKRRMYTQARAFLQRPAAEALLRVSEEAKKDGVGLLIFDAYRPWSVTKKFWDETPPKKRNFVANPKKGSKHNRGCAVDLTLYYLSNGTEVEMPSAYDDFSERAAVRFSGGTAEQRQWRDLLRSLMESEGFDVNSEEWWHFDHRDWRNYRILNTPFEHLP